MELKKRKLLRLKNFDYNSNAYYFITICTYKRIPYFGEIRDSKLVPQCPVLERIIDNSLEDLEIKFPGVEVIQSSLMPSHIHFILANESNGSFNLGQIIRRFKSTSTIACKKEVDNGSVVLIDDKLWQRNYHEIIIRNQSQLEALWKYSEENPMKWELDKYYRK